MSDTNIQVVQKIYAAFGRGDVPGILEFISDDLKAFGIVSDSAKDIPWHLQITSKKDVPKFFEALGAATEFTRFEPKDFAAGGDHVYATMSYDVTMRSNGKKLTFEHGMHRFTFKNGRIVEWHGTEDTAKVLRALKG